MPIAIMADSNGNEHRSVAHRRRSIASPEEPLPVLPVDEGLLTTAATGVVVVVVAPALVEGTVVVVVDVGVVDVS